MKPAAWCGLLLVSLALAGCSDAAPGPAGEPAAGAGPSAPLEAPVWEAGQHWRYTGDQGDFTLVVSSVSDGHYITDTTDEEMAMYDVREDISFVGPIRSSDLSGAQGGQPVLFFAWPLLDGASWKTTWDGVERTITAATQEDGTVRLTATQDGRTAVEYTYDPEVAWITSMQFTDENGTQTGFRLQGSGTGFAGEFYRWSIDEALDARWGGAGGSSSGFPVPEGVAWLEYQASIDCGDATAGQRTLQMGLGEDPGTGMVLLMEQDPPVDMAVTCPDEVLERDRIEARPGRWGVESVSGSDAGLTTLQVDLLTRQAMSL